VSLPHCAGRLTAIARTDAAMRMCERFKYLHESPFGSAIGGLLKGMDAQEA
jgi:hypothetical protein